MNFFRVRITVPRMSYYCSSYSTIYWVNILIWLTLRFVFCTFPPILAFLLPTFLYRSPFMMVLLNSIFRWIKEYFFFSSKETLMFRSKRLINTNMKGHSYFVNRVIRYHFNQIPFKLKKLVSCFHWWTAFLA